MLGLKRGFEGWTTGGRASSPGNSLGLMGLRGLFAGEFPRDVAVVESASVVAGSADYKYRSKSI